MVICIGVLIFLISFFGCCGAFQSNICLLDTYSICLTVLVLLQIILACFIFIFIDGIEKGAAKKFNRAWQSRANSREARGLISMLQENLKCCGSKDMHDYRMPNTIPKSCCNQGQNVCNKKNSWKIGCKAHIQNFIKSSGRFTCYFCIGTAIFELMGAITGFILSGYLRKVKQLRRCCY